MLNLHESDDAPVSEDENSDAAIIRRAHRRFKKCKAWEAIARQNWMDDLKFANGDSYNNYQWPQDIYGARTGKPNLTVNQVRQHNLHISNEAKQNKTSVKYRPIGDGASEESAEVWEGIYRHISNISNAQMVQGKAIDFQVQAGLGFTRIMADYADQKSFDQEIYIRGIPNPLACYLDPDGIELDGSDARYGFVFADKPRDEMETQYPQLKNATASNAVDNEDSGWIRDDHIREAEYYEVGEEKDELLGNDEGLTVLRSQCPDKLVKQWEAEAEANGSELRRRPVVTKNVKWFKIAGDFIVDRTDVPGTSVPIIPWVGEVTIIDQQLDRKGHTRALISAQQMLNYNWSGSVEFGALQNKSPWVAPAKAIEGYETYWQTANTEAHSILPYNSVDDNGETIPAPTRQDPPQAAPVFIEGAQMAGDFMQSASGQHEAEMGEPGNEKSGKAINERQRQSDRATYHFVDNQALAIRRQGQIILEWVPLIYDTKRVIKIIGEDGDETHVQVDPQAEEAHVMAENSAAAIFNPSVGRYEVVSDVGPDYATQRQEAFNAIVQILTQAPELINKIGDLLFKVADFPLADEIAERLKPGMSPEAQKAIQGLQEQLQKGNKLLGETMQALAEERLRTKGKDSKSDVEAFDADTRRLTALKDALGLDPEALHVMVRETIRQALQDNLGPVRGAADADLSVVPGAGDDEPGATASNPLEERGPDAAQMAGAGV